MWTWWNSTSTEWQQRTSITHIQGCHGDSNQYNLVRYQPGNMTHVSHEGNTSAVFHMKTSMGSLWAARTLSQCHPWSTVGCHPNSATVKATKFVGPHKSRMHQYIINLVHLGQAIGPQSTQAGATTFEALNMKTYHSQPFCPASHKDINPIAKINHIEPPSWEGALLWAVSTTRLLPITYFTKHSLSTVLIHHRGKQGIFVSENHNAMSFHPTPTRKCTIMNIR
jgi:hypothetical protein